MPTSTDHAHIHELLPVFQAFYLVYIRPKVNGIRNRDITNEDKERNHKIPAEKEG